MRWSQQASANELRHLVAVPVGEWLAQVGWAVLWVVTVESVFVRVRAGTTVRMKGWAVLPESVRPLDIVVLVGVVALLMPAIVVAEGGLQWGLNRLLYSAGHSDAQYMCIL